MTALILNKENVEHTKIHKLYINHPRKHFHWWGLIIDSEKKYSYNICIKEMKIVPRITIKNTCHKVRVVALTLVLMKCVERIMVSGPRKVPCWIPV